MFGGVAGRGAGMFFFEAVEILRRTVWAIFRIEWEVVVKVYSSSYGAVPLQSATSDDSGALSSDETQPIAKEDE